MTFVLCLEKPGMQRSGPTLSAFRGPASPVGAAQAEHLLQQQNASAAGLPHPTFVRLRVSVKTWSQNVRFSTCPFYLTVSGRLGGWMARREGPEPPALAAAQVEVWQEGHAAAAGSCGPSGDLKNLLLRRRLGQPLLFAGPAGPEGAA